MQKQIYSYTLKGTAKELEKMEEVMSMDDMDSKNGKKYFHTWVHHGTGRYYFPKEKYFVSRTFDGVEVTNYAVAILKYGSMNGSEIEAR